MRLEFDFAWNIVDATIFHIAENGGGPNQNVGVPDSCHTEVLVWLNGNKDAVILILVFDGFHPLGLGQRKKGPLHRVALIAEPQIDDGRKEQIKLWIVESASPHSSVRRLGVVRIFQRAN